MGLFPAYACQHTIIGRVDVEAEEAASEAASGPSPLVAPSPPDRSTVPSSARTTPELLPAGPCQMKDADGWDWTDQADAYPLAAAGLTFTEVAGGFVVTRPEGSATAHTINTTGVLLLELANGRYSRPEP